DFQQLTTALRIEDGRVHLSDARLGSTHSGEFTLAGSVGLNGSLDYRVHALLPKRYLPPDLRDQKALVDLLVDANGRLPLDFIVTGSVSNPKVKVDLAQLQSQAAGRAKQQLQAKGENEVKKATEKAAKSAKQALEGILDNLGKKKPPAAPPDSGRGSGGSP
ncbi:MAG TPA: AsmA-like C-terminal region-containing protein, partial [Candidatus Udaeobacter sp.]|nr:AsmA-like C-terminal region-containing protein [Candidatus Udaeobacter sp.]